LEHPQRRWTSSAKRGYLRIFARLDGMWASRSAYADFNPETCT
jgi:hypothetical protein